MMKMNNVFLLGIFALFMHNNLHAKCIIKMVYKENSKMPLINAAPNNNGFYFNLYNKAANEIGCILKIRRFPKKRLHKMLNSGALDFYPGVSISKERSKYLYYLPVGFETAQFGITSSTVPEINSYSDIKKHKLTWLMELGSSKNEIAKSYKIETLKTPVVNIEKILKMRSLGRDGFTILDKEPIDYYLKENKLINYTSIGLKIHKHCCGGIKPMYLGFSKSSPHFKELINERFDPKRVISPINNPSKLDPNCIASKFANVLNKLSTSGETLAIYESYILNDFE
ncbi:hypothetical protein SAMN02745724_04867 [Pseudoalteromonas denitrificans DSM 6059]|uniref:Solute-binding protein family 3/N-terminal domain-containing protein n=2 Tax=Pseudoalteromonas TaxID=53246 RepID=A0A1I1TEM4_9GAMM|nr:hypothetical protein SAMN02745724_04867 [Pseudoalteromonas denitrificans DSM 6059]